MATKSNYGQNGFDGASSDLPGEKTSSRFLPKVDLASAVNVQQREVSDKQYPTTFGHKNPNAAPRTIPGALVSDQGEPSSRKPG